ncbi:MAG: hypothetical protein M3Y69_05795 [Verrucomicrobiota bacterium]|nr:hypothetical protein [Verrucomicrobiota bacterium]
MDALYRIDVLFGRRDIAEADAADFKNAGEEHRQNERGYHQLWQSAATLAFEARVVHQYGIYSKCHAASSRDSLRLILLRTDPANAMFAAIAV